ncbi:hypothetical protein [Paraburkholderia caribensis]|uniref:hypothetical protein n=1 Tax=Paraburkholderia caribensis TaxID=75105 RepID=UPI00072001AA|nr:hypothetical protein [Paraburkholderia caribensis]ALP65201.1 hypothetical protein AN416_21635 [Paraburkholderia caribensis]AUT53646.1 hypothetical protein C2L66_16855 [Paraburkholderia caribensis]
MKLIIETKTGSSIPTSMPEGVTVLKQLDSASVLVDATPAGERALRSQARLSVRRQATISPDPVDEGRHIDVFKALADARARREKLGI